MKPENGQSVLVATPTKMALFKLSTVSLQVWGSFLQRKRNTPWRRRQSLINLIVLPGVMLVIAYSIYRYYPDLAQMSDLLAYETGFAIAYFKLPFLHCQLHHFEALYDRITVLNTFATAVELVEIDRANKVASRYGILNFISLVGGDVVLLFGPLAKAAYTQFVLHAEHDQWPVPLNIAVDLTPGVQYWMFSAWILYSFVILCITDNAMDVMFLESCLICAGHFKILRQRYRRLDCSKPEAEFVKDLIALLKYTEETVQTVHQLKQAFEEIVNIFFTLVAFLLCFVTFTVSLTPTDPKIGYQCGFIVSVYLQLWFFTYGGTSILSEAEAIVDSIYSIDWTRLMPSQRRWLVQAMINAQHLGNIQMKFYAVNQTTFRKILVTSISYITLLRSFMGHN